MGNSKKHYDLALKDLKKSIAALGNATRNFEISSLNMDDFPTARHEIKELAEQSEALLLKTDALWSKAEVNKIR